MKHYFCPTFPLIDKKCPMSIIASKLKVEKRAWLQNRAVKYFFSFPFPFLFLFKKKKEVCAHSLKDVSQNGPK